MTYKGFDPFISLDIINGHKFIIMIEGLVGNYYVCEKCNCGLYRTNHKKYAKSTLPEYCYFIDNYTNFNFYKPIFKRITGKLLSCTEVIIKNIIE